MHLGMLLIQISKKWVDSAVEAKERGPEVTKGSAVQTEGLAIETEGPAVETKGLTVEAKGSAAMWVGVVAGKNNIVYDNIKEQVGSNEQWLELRAYNLLKSIWPCIDVMRLKSLVRSNFNESDYETEGKKAAQQTI